MTEVNWGEKRRTIIGTVICYGLGSRKTAIGHHTALTQFGTEGELNARVSGSGPVVEEGAGSIGQGFHGINAVLAAFGQARSLGSLARAKQSMDQIMLNPHDDTERCDRRCSRPNASDSEKRRITACGLTPK